MYMVGLETISNEYSFNICKTEGAPIKKINLKKMKNNLWQINFISWQIDEETMNRVRNFIFGGSKITVVTADGDYSQEIKRHLLL